MNFVYRAGAARRNLFDEIPLAQRTNPIRRFSSRAIRIIVFFLVFITFSGTFLGSRFFFSINKNMDQADQMSKNSKDGSLLGHYPYQEADEIDLITLYPGLRVHKDIAAVLREMQNDAFLEGVHLVYLSGFRSIELQEKIFYENKSARNQIAIERAKVSAPPGYSEHSTGYAIDIGDRYRRETDFEVEFEGTPAFRWLNKNAAKYHFILSFPKGNPQKVSYEPWHWRYEGTVEALKKFETANKIRRESKP